MTHAHQNVLPPVWKQMRYHAVQNIMWRCPTRFAAVVAGRGSGKTDLARKRTVIHLPIKKKWPNPIYVYGLPTYNQAKKVAWDPIKALIPESWISSVSVSELTIKTIFGSTLYIVGMDKPYRIEGLQIDGIVLDESSDQKPGIFDKTVRPMLTERNGWCWRIGVPKRAGVGRVDFQSFFKMGNQYTVDNYEIKQNDNQISSFWWESADILSDSEMESIKSTTNEQDFNEQYRAHFLDMGGSVYHAFSSDNVRKEIQYDPSKRILVGMDFNVDPMCWILCQMHGNILHVFDEVAIRNTNTEAALKHLRQKYSFHDQGWTFIGDASSKARKTSASKSDYLQIKNMEGFGDKKVVFARRNPPVLDRFATVNSALCNAKGLRRILINPNCKFLINDFSVMSFKEGMTEVENYDGTDIGHMSDGLGYLCMRAIPMKLDRKEAPTIITSDAA